MLVVSMLGSAEPKRDLRGVSGVGWTGLPNTPPCCDTLCPNVGCDICPNTDWFSCAVCPKETCWPVQSAQTRMMHQSGRMSLLIDLNQSVETKMHQLYLMSSQFVQP
ncbi:hypothetical protein DPMN_166191 [Dreissena polymorpha]|uniref:Uncharacterized protein n=1 Tax=Dreissena polymorpha TaxID=45954 RepID=A0A9D4ITY0_DREPO|nr:hypothetical protein DPMN_166191 [Dreissena polymorpha]